MVLQKKKKSNQLLLEEPIIAFEICSWAYLQEQNKELDMKWRLKSYPSEHYANVRFILEDEVSGKFLTIFSLSKMDDSIGDKSFVI